jgi:hypothetical protein
MRGIKAVCKKRKSFLRKILINHQIWMIPNLKKLLKLDQIQKKLLKKLLKQIKKQTKSLQNHQRKVKTKMLAT